MFIVRFGHQTKRCLPFRCDGAERENSRFREMGPPAVAYRRTGEGKFSAKALPFPPAACWRLGREMCTAASDKYCERPNASAGGEVDEILTGMVYYLAMGLYG